MCSPHYMYSQVSLGNYTVKKLIPGKKNKISYTSTLHNLSQRNLASQSPLSDRAIV